MYTFLVDFDGTITLEDTLDGLFERFADSSWHELDAAWARGEISTAQQVRSGYALVAADRSKIDAYLDSLGIDTTFPAFVAWCHDHDWPLQVVSDGLDYHIDRILRRHALEALPVITNHMHFEAHQPTFTFPHMCPYICPLGDRSEGICKRLTVEQAAASGATTIFIGDGVSDRCAVPVADRVFAKGSLARYCRERGIAYTPFETFADVMCMIENAI